MTDKPPTPTLPLVYFGPVDPAAAPIDWRATDPELLALEDADMAKEARLGHRDQAHPFVADSTVSPTS